MYFRASRGVNFSKKFSEVSQNCGGCFPEAFRILTDQVTFNSNNVKTSILQLKGHIFFYRCLQYF